MRIGHVITGLERHGAELMLQRLVAALDPDRFQSFVISLTTLGPVGKELRELGFDVEALGMPPGMATPRGMAGLALLLRRRDPDVVQTWLYHADLVGGVAARACTGARVVWSVRQEALDRRAFKRRTRWTASVCARLARFIPHHVLYCSSRAAASHIALGYPAGRATVIPNGFDLGRFQPDPSAAADVRSELDLPMDSKLVGLFGRFNPQKEHRRFLEAIAIVRQRRSNVYAILAGEGVTTYEPRLVGWVDDLGLGEVVRLVGLRTDMSRLTAALDVAVSASAPGEGFPNVIGEAMACSVPCVVTESGESPEIVGETGRVVRGPGALPIADALVELLSDEAARLELGRRARLRIAAEYALPAIVERYETFYSSITRSTRATEVDGSRPSPAGRGRGG